MAVKIGILGWGSLIWKQKQLSVRAPFQKCALKLPIEFSRISKGGRITLVIDEAHGRLCNVQYCLSKYKSVEDVRENLRNRERTNCDGIGSLEFTSDETPIWKNPPSPSLRDSIAKWAKSEKLFALVWTALGSNFPARINRRFSVETAMEHLRGLSVGNRIIALKYIKNAPAEISTPVRRAVISEYRGVMKTLI